MSPEVGVSEAAASLVAGSAIETGHVSYIDTSLQGLRPSGFEPPPGLPHGGPAHPPGCVGTGETQQGIVDVIDRDVQAATRSAGLIAQAGLKFRTHASVEMFLAAARPEKACCLLYDVHTSSGLAQEFDLVLKLLRECAPVIVASSKPDVHLAVQAIKGGAVDFLLKPLRPGELLQAVRTALLQDGRRRASHAAQDDLRRRFSRLTPRERQVLALVTAGLLNKQIAFDLGLSEITVKVHRGSAVRKMGARSLPELVRMADAIRELAPATGSSTA
jgi:FixJ family two-component response regulator